MGVQVTPAGIFTFVNVAKTSKFDGEDTGKYEITMLFDKEDDLSVIYDAATAAAKEKFGPNVNMGALKNPFTDGDTKDSSTYIGYAGRIAVKFSTKKRPLMVDAERNPILDYDEVYSGCIGRIGFYAWAYDNKSRGVGLTLVSVLKLADGPRLGGIASDPEKDFADVSGADSVKAAEKMAAKLAESTGAGVQASGKGQEDASGSSFPGQN